jgi:hypothetical protein
MLHSSAHPHTAKSLCQLNFEVLKHPPCNPDLDTSGFHLLIHSKTLWEAAISPVTKKLKNQCIQQLVDQLIKGVGKYKDYTEKLCYCTLILIVLFDKKVGCRYFLTHPQSNFVNSKIFLHFVVNYFHISYKFLL